MLFNFNFSDVKLNSDFSWKLFIFFCMILIVCSASNDVFAGAGPVPPTVTTSDPFGTALCNVVSALSGNIAKAIATAAIFATALGFFSGKLQWQTVAVLSVGIVTIFSAGTLVNFLGGATSKAGAC